MESKVLLNFKVEESLKDTFHAVAKSNDQSTSQLLREFMRDYIKKHSQPDLFVTKRGKK